MYNSPRKETKTNPAKIWPITRNVPCPALPKIFVPQPFSPVAPFFKALKSDKMCDKVKTNHYSFKKLVLFLSAWRQPDAQIKLLSYCLWRKAAHFDTITITNLSITILI